MRMTTVSLLVVIACTEKPAGDTQPTGDTDSADTVPTEVVARYVTALKWEEGGAHVVRLANLELADDGSAQASAWLFSNLTFGGYADVIPVGSSAQPDVPTADTTAAVQGLDTFLNTPPESLTGTWETDPDDALLFHLTWSDGDTEAWRRTWSDGLLDKVEAAAVSRADVPTDTYLSGGPGAWTRNDSAVNAGFGFGGADVPPWSATADTSGLYNNYAGRYCRWNGYYTPPADDEGVQSDQTNLNPYFWLTDTGVYRYVRSDAELLVYSYLVLVPDRIAETPNAVVYQTSHDFDGDGNIADGPGHTYQGLLIVDAAGVARGWVYADQSYDPGISQVMILSSMYYLDDFDDAAHTGIE